MEIALSGVRILDLTRHLAGPFASMLLADMGAEVIKIEEPKGREEAPPFYSYKGQDAYYLSVNRSKKSIVLNLKKPGGLEVCYDLVRKADVVMDNYRPGVLERLRIDYEALCRVNPQIVSCSITGYGPSGPYRDRPSYDLAAQALSGIMSLTGEMGRPPVRAGVAVADLCAGIFAAQGILAALFYRERHGRGQKVDTSLLEAAVALLSYEASGYFVSGEVPGPSGSGHRFMNPYRAYQTRDGYIVVAAMYSFDKLCRAIGREELAGDPRFSSLPLRFEHRKELNSLLEQVFLARSAGEWLRILHEGDVPCAPVNALDKALADPQVLAREMVVSIEHTLGGAIKVVGNPVKLSATPPERRRQYFSPPIYGQHTDEVLANLLGYSAEKIEELRREKVI